MLEKTLSIFKTIQHPTRTVLHVGMGGAEEFDTYKAHGFQNVIYVEGDVDACDRVGVKKECAIVQAFISDEERESDFYGASNNGLSSSLYRPSQHLKRFPDVKFKPASKVKTTTLSNALKNLDVYKAEELDLLVLDIQGAELPALKGFVDIDRPAAIQLEVNYVDMYQGCSMFKEVLQFMRSKDFELVSASRQGGYGEALFLNTRNPQHKEVNFVDKDAAPFSIRLSYGLSDRLGQIQAGKFFAEKFLSRPLQVITTGGRAFLADFQDYFEPIPGVEFVSSGQGKALNQNSRHWSKSFLQDSLARGDVNVKVKPFVKAEVKRVLSGTDNLLAVHIRRTDKIRNNQSKIARSTQDACAAIDRHNGDVFLATDCPETQKTLLQLYGGRLKVYETFTRKPNELRHTSSLHAVVDMIVCMEAANFDGDPSSGWYGMVEAFRAKNFSFL